MVREIFGKKFIFNKNISKEVIKLGINKKTLENSKK
jgi:hypothetical protein